MYGFNFRLRIPVMASIKDYPQRYALTGELHARPFPSLEAPSTAVFLAIKEPDDAANRDKSRDLAHLVALLDHYGAPRPSANATHYYGEMGKYWLKWEQHTEHVTYTVFRDEAGERAFDPGEFDVSRSIGWPMRRVGGSPLR